MHLQITTIAALIRADRRWRCSLLWFLLLLVISCNSRAPIIEKGRQRVVIAPEVFSSRGDSVGNSRATVPEVSSSAGVYGREIDLRGSAEEPAVPVSSSFPAMPEPASTARPGAGESATRASAASTPPVLGRSPLASETPGAASDAAKVSPLPAGEVTGSSQSTLSRATAAATIETGSPVGIAAQPEPRPAAGSYSGDNAMAAAGGSGPESVAAESESGAISPVHPPRHVVTAGDTLISIAFRYDLDYQSLARANGIPPPYRIYVGQEIAINRKLVADTAGSVMVPAAESARRSSTGRTDGKTTSDSDAGFAADAHSARAAAPGAGEQLEQPASLQPQSGGQTRDDVSRSTVSAWQWPHGGKLVQGFRAGTSKGIEISGNVGDPVLAAGAGDVVYSGVGVQGTSNLIIIRHNERFLSAYAHNSAILVPQGAQVNAGQQIAELGVNDEGNPMLHFEIRQRGMPVDPEQFLPPRMLPQP